MHKYNKSETTNTQEQNQLTSTLKKSKAKYSIYLNHYHYSNSKSINLQISDKPTPCPKVTFDVNYSPTEQNIKRFGSSICSPKGRELNQNMSNRYINSEGIEQNFISLTSPGMLDSNESNESNLNQNKPQSSNYSMIAFKKDFCKMHTKNISKNRILEKKRKELEKHNKLLKEASISKRFSQSNQTTAYIESGKLVNHGSFMYQKTSASKGMYCSKNSIYKNYWKNKTAKYSLTKQKSQSKNKYFYKPHEKYFSKADKAEAAKTGEKERRKSTAKESMTISTQLYESFSK